MSEKSLVKDLIVIAIDQLHEAVSILEDLKVTTATKSLARVLDRLEETEATLKEAIEKGFWR
jgi:hypothetical protein